MTVTPVEEEVNTKIKEMGYILAIPVNVYPSIYRLKDESIIKVEVLINHLIADPHKANGFSINSTNIFSSLVPKDRRRPDLYRPYSQNDINQNVVIDDVEFDVLQEKFSTYELSNDFTLDLKPVLAQVRKTGFYTMIGEPVYTMHYNPIIKFKKK